MCTGRAWAQPGWRDADRRHFDALDRICAATEANAAKDFATGLQHSLAAIALLDTSSASLPWAEAECQRAVALMYLDRGQEAIQHARHARQLAQQAWPQPNPVGAAITTELGIVLYLNSANLRHAREVLEEAVDDCMNMVNQDEVLQSRALLYLGSCCRRQGEHERAMEFYRQSLLIRQRVLGASSEEAVSSQLSLGNVQFETEEYEKAKASFEAAIDAALKGGHINRAIDLKNNLAVTLVELGEYQKARDLYLEVERHYSRPGDERPARVITAMQNSALVLVRMKAYAQAEAQFDRLLRYATAHEADPEIMSEIESDHTFYFGETHQFDSALVSIQRSIHWLLPDISAHDIRQNPTLQETIDHYGLITPLMTKGELLLVTGKAKGDNEALLLGLRCFDLVLGALDEVWTGTDDPGDKLHINQRGVSMYEQALDITHQLWKSTGDRAHLEKAFEYMERGKSQLMMEAIRRSRAAFLTDVPAALHERVLALRARLSDLDRRSRSLAGNPDSLAMIQDLIVAGRLEQTHLSDSIDRLYPAYSEMVGQRSPVSFTLLQQRFARPEEMLVEYFLSDTVLYVLSIVEGRVAFRRATLGAAFSADYDRFLAALQASRRSDQAFQNYQQAGLALYQLLLKPEVDGAGAALQRIRIVPDGMLAAFPFEALPVGPATASSGYQGLDLAIHHYLISYAPAASLIMDFMHTARPRFPTECLGFAWSSGSEEPQQSRVAMPGKAWPDIPGTAGEVKAIERKVFGRYLMGQQATEQAFKELAGQYGLIHLALHGSASHEEPILAFPEPGPGQDGTLYLDELYNLRLSARLTVLSACETGLGTVRKGEGVMSMARGFGIAGCPSVVMSLWEVDDRSSSLIMEEFYQGLALGKEVDEALRDAKLHYLQVHEGHGAAPFYWASFIPMGKTSPIILHRKNATWPFALGLLAFALASAAVFVVWHSPKNVHPITNPSTES